MTPKEHALAAKALLDAETALTGRLDEMTEDERLQMVVTGGFSRLNRDREFSIALAQAHALTSIALVLIRKEGER